MFWWFYVWMQGNLVEQKVQATWTTLLKWDPNRMQKKNMTRFAIIESAFGACHLSFQFQVQVNQYPRILCYSTSYDSRHILVSHCIPWHMHRIKSKSLKALKQQASCSAKIKSKPNTIHAKIRLGPNWTREHSDKEFKLKTCCDTLFFWSYPLSIYISTVHCSDQKRVGAKHHAISKC